MDMSLFIFAICAICFFLAQYIYYRALTAKAESEAALAAADVKLKSVPDWDKEPFSYGAIVDVAACRVCVVARYVIDSEVNTLDIVIKSFVFDENDPEDSDFACREAEELVEKLREA